ncbi:MULTISPECIES: YezD family protein [Paenibacillus]|uniref:Uncharacterized protein n=1 Tax=Paenibacillus naphthalenovorans TaxID=162209 RepID=A0A0U2UJQ6_9BACL|nr:MULTISPECIES: YezD family protein [Paenibacillus]ALS23388.1 hypothetical protein IJ22_30150 [Paenibacillus naphthalenovorans]GCL72869.1 DUF2292 domain-containing protein [Paenibacillus naphthalenovorans]SDI06867.1 hypothetical protein SAMN05421868_10314 [Paenibacillus naphthalenovorans]
MLQVAKVTDEWLERIKEQVTGIQYGTVQITIHNGQIVQIDRTERSRYDVAKAPAAVRRQR